MLCKNPEIMLTSQSLKTTLLIFQLKINNRKHLLNRKCSFFPLSNKPNLQSSLAFPFFSGDSFSASRKSAATPQSSFSRLTYLLNMDADTDGAVLCIHLASFHYIQSFNVFVDCFHIPDFLCRHIWVRIDPLVLAQCLRNIL